MSQDSFFFFLIYVILLALVLSFLIIIIKLILGMIKTVFRKFFPAKTRIVSKKNEEKIENINKPKQQIVDNNFNKSLNIGSEEKKEQENNYDNEENKGTEPQQKTVVQPKISPIGNVNKDANDKDVSGKYLIKDIDKDKNNGIVTKHGIIRPGDILEKEKIFKPKTEQVLEVSGKENRKAEEILPHEKSVSLKNNSADTSIFGGKSEISRTDLRQRLKSDSGVFRATQEAGLNLNPTERAKLEKEVFSQSYGGNISKADLKLGIRKLSQKMMGEKNFVEKGKIRKEIKFFKKIGGIKE